jgi:hypothetical protein
MSPTGSLRSLQFRPLIPRVGALLHTLCSAKHTKQRPHRAYRNSGNEHEVDSRNWSAEQHRKRYLVSSQNKLEDANVKISWDA